MITAIHNIEGPLVSLFVVLVFCSTSYAQELQRPKQIFVENQEWQRGNIEAPPFKFDKRWAEVFDKPKLRIKWAIVSGEFGRVVDQVRGRFLFNDNQWIDLYVKRNAMGGYEQNVVKIYRTDKFPTREMALDVEISNVDEEESDSIELPTPDDIRIVEWDHEELILKFQRENELPRFYQFDMSRNPNR